MPDLAPKARAREQIDALLMTAGRTLQNYDRFDPTVARFIALREIPVKGGRCDYLLLADRLPISVVEAKKAGMTCLRLPNSPCSTATTCLTSCSSRAGRWPFMIVHQGGL